MSINTSLLRITGCHSVCLCGTLACLAYSLAIQIEQDKSRTSYAQAECGKDCVTFAVAKRAVHIRRKQGEAEAR